MYMVWPRKIWISPQGKLLVNCKHQAKVVTMELMTGEEQRGGTADEQWGPCTEWRGQEETQALGGRWVCSQRK